MSTDRRDASDSEEGKGKERLIKLRDTGDDNEMFAVRREEEKKEDAEEDDNDKDDASNKKQKGGEERKKLIDMSMMMMTTVTVDPFQHPLLLVIVGGVVTAIIGGLLVAWITKRWQDNKTKTEIRVNLTQEMSELIAFALGRIFTAISQYKSTITAEPSRTSSDKDAPQLHEEFEKLFTKSNVLNTKLRAYFPSSDIHEKWKDCGELMLNIWDFAAKMYLFLYG